MLPAFIRLRRRPRASSYAKASEGHVSPRMNPVRNGVSNGVNALDGPSTAFLTFEALAEEVAKEGALCFGGIAPKMPRALTHGASLF